MVTIAYDPSFEKKVRKIKDQVLKLKVKNKILKIVDSPEIGKPLAQTETRMAAMIINDIVLIVHNVIFNHVILRQHPD